MKKLLLLLIVIAKLSAIGIISDFSYHASVGGPVTVFYTERSTPRGESSQQVVQSGITLYKVKPVTNSGTLIDLAELLVEPYCRDNTGYYAARIILVEDIIKPKDTDSIQVGGRTGYPYAGDAVWIFSACTGRINLYSGFINRAVILRHKEKDGKLVLLPETLRPSPDPLRKKGRSSIQIGSDEIADSLARFPRLFCEYGSTAASSICFFENTVGDTVIDYSQKYIYDVVTNFNDLPEEKLMSPEQALHISPMTRNIYMKKWSELSFDGIYALLSKDSTNVIGHLKIAEKFYHQNSMDSMKAHIDLAEQFSYPQDYLVLTAKGKYAERMGDYASADSLYSSAYKAIPQGSNNMQREISDCLREVRSKITVQPTIDIEGIEGELDLEL